MNCNCFDILDYKSLKENKQYTKNSEKMNHNFQEHKNHIKSITNFKLKGVQTFGWFCGSCNVEWKTFNLNDAVKCDKKLTMSPASNIHLLSHRDVKEMFNDFTKRNENKMFSLGNYNYTNNFWDKMHIISKILTNYQYLQLLPIRSTIIMLYKRFITYINYNKLQNQYVIQPYAVGKDKRSVAMILPAKVVKALKINPQSIFLLLQINNDNDLRIKIIREEDLTDSKYMTSVDQSLGNFPTDIVNK